MNNEKHKEQKLNQMQELFLESVACFGHGTKLTGIELTGAGMAGAGVDDISSFLEELAEFSAIHKLSPAVFEVLRTSFPAELMTDNATWKSWKGSVVREVLFQDGRTAGFLSVYNKLTEVGVKPLVVKGIVCRSLYEKSDYRISADEDIFVKLDEAAVCDKILLESGFCRGEVDFNNLPYEVAYRNPLNGVYLELHFSLFDEASDAFGGLNEAFKGVHEDAVSIKVQNVDIWTLQPTKHFFYLLCHAYKHFLHSGFGVRQVLDIVRMAEVWGAEIDWQYIITACADHQMERFFRGLLHIGSGWLYMDDKIYRYLGQTTPTVAEARKSAFDLLLDILQAGVYGSSTKERQHSANITLAAVEKENALLRSLFPSADYLKAHYSFAKKYPVLLPAAWCRRLGGYLLERAKNGSRQSERGSTENSLEIGKRRVELLRKYGLID